LEAVFILLEFPFPSRKIFIGSHSLPPSLVRRIGPSQAHSKPKGAGLTRAMNPESVPVNFPETDKGIKIVR
jgi:hypothetical protein